MGTCVLPFVLPGIRANQLQPPSLPPRTPPAVPSPVAKNQCHHAVFTPLPPALPHSPQNPQQKKKKLIKWKNNCSGLQAAHCHRAVIADLQAGRRMGAFRKSPANERVLIRPQMNASVYCSLANGYLQLNGLISK